MTPSMTMEKDWNHMAERILDLTLEIIYLLTGEDCKVVIKTSGESLTRNSCPPGTSPIIAKNGGHKVLEVTQMMIELLTGEVPIRCQDVTVYFSMEEWEYLEGHRDLYKDVMMDNQQMFNYVKIGKPKLSTSAMMLKLILEIIYLMTGKDCDVVMKTSTRNNTKGGSHSLSPELREELSPITVSSLPVEDLERNSKQKILEVINKIIELVMSEVPIRCQDVTVYFSVEEWEYLEGHKDLYKDVMMASQAALTSPDGSSNGNPPERCPRPLYSWDSTQEDLTIPHHPQDLIYMKVEIKEEEEEEEEETLCGDQQSMEEGEIMRREKESSLDIGTERKNMPDSAPQPDMAVADSSVEAQAAQAIRRRRRTRTGAPSRKKNLCWTQVESEVLVRETLPCWVQLSGSKARETTPEWKRGTWEEIARKVTLMSRQQRDWTACRKKFNDIKRAIARKRRQAERRRRVATLLSYEAELLAGIGEDEISNLLAHQDRRHTQVKKRRRAGACSSSSESTIIDSSDEEGAGEFEEERNPRVAAVPTSVDTEDAPAGGINHVQAAGEEEEEEEDVPQSDMAGPRSPDFTLQLHPEEEEEGHLDLSVPGSSSHSHYLSSAAGSPAHPPSHPPHLGSPPHLSPPMGASSPGPSVEHSPPSPVAAPPPEPDVSVVLRQIREAQEELLVVSRRILTSLDLRNRLQRRYHVAMKRGLSRLGMQQEAQLSYLGDQLARLNWSVHQAMIGETPLQFDPEERRRWVEQVHGHRGSRGPRTRGGCWTRRRGGRTNL